MKTLILTLSLVLVSCASTKEVERIEIHDTAYAVQPPVIDQTFPTWHGPYLPGYEGWFIKGKDTVTQVQVDTVNHFIHVKTKPDSVFFHDHDTTETIKYITTVEETPFLSKLGLVLIGLGVAVIAGVVLKLKGIL